MNRFNDAIGFLKTMNFRRTFNMIKVYTSFYLTRILKRPIQWGMPFSVSVEPTTACNLRCPECPSGLRSFSRMTGNLKQDLFEHYIKDIAAHVNYMSFYFQGEPYIHPAFLDMVKVAKSKRIYVSTSTNAHFMDEQKAIKTVESGLDRLIISIDGTTQESYVSYRKEGQLSKVIEGTRNIIKARKDLNAKTPYVIFQFLVVRANEHQIDEVKALADELGVDEVKYKTAQIYDYKHGSSLMPVNERFSRYAKQADGHYTLKHKLLNQCWKLWHACVITWDGWVVPCCFDKDAKYQMGNLKHESLQTVWKNKAYQQFRRNIVNSRSSIDICTNCTEGCKVFSDV